MTRAVHEYNRKLVMTFLQANKQSAFNRQEVANNANISRGAAKSILHELFKQNLVERHIVKERGELRTYYNWKRCEHLAHTQCVQRETECVMKKKCCIYCDRIGTCNTVCLMALQQTGQLTETPQDTNQAEPT